MPSAAQRSSVRGFRRNSAASSSFVRNSERSGSEFDIAISITAISRVEMYTRLNIKVGGSPVKSEAGIPPIFKIGGSSVHVGGGGNPPYLVAIFRLLAVKRHESPRLPQRMLDRVKQALVHTLVPALICGFVGGV